MLSAYTFVSFERLWTAVENVSCPLVAGKKINTAENADDDCIVAAVFAAVLRRRHETYRRRSIRDAMKNTSKPNRAYVIANLSTNHEGNVSLANEMIEQACVSHL